MLVERRRKYHSFIFSKMLWMYRGRGLYNKREEIKEENIKRHHKIDEQIVYTLLNNRKFIYKYILHSTILGFQPHLVISE